MRIQNLKPFGQVLLHRVQVLLARFKGPEGPRLEQHPRHFSAYDLSPKSPHENDFYPTAGGAFRFVEIAKDTARTSPFAENSSEKITTRAR